MKETRFIAQNKEKWLESETLLADSQKDPEKLSNLFTQVVDDLSYSRTYYQNRSVRVYLNKIAREYFSIIYSHQKEKKNRFKLFWLDEIPQLVIYSRKQLIISLVVFLFSATIGVFSSMKDSHFASSILGEDYVSMTKENIKNGDPMAVYKKGHQADMFLGITINNLRVAFMTYVFGIFMSIGTISILVSNGIMVGCFQYFFVEHGLLAESALTIWLHGTLEISSIILAGGAGLVLGTGLIFPGTYSRLQAFQITATRSLKLMLGIAPIFVLAGFIESFLTRYTDVPDVVRLILIILSATFIIGYFVVYPWLKSKKGFEVPLTETKLAASEPETIRYNRIKSNAEIIKDTFSFFKTNIGSLFPWILSLSLVVTTFDFTFTHEERAYDGNVMNYFFADLFYALKTPSPLFILINGASCGLLTYQIMRLIDRDEKKATEQHANWKALSQITLVMMALYGVIYSLDEWGITIVALTFMMLFTLAFTLLSEGKNVLNGIVRTAEILKGNIGLIMGSQIILFMISFSFLIILSAPLLYMYTDILQWNFAKTDTWSKNIIGFIEIFIKNFAFNMILPIVAATASYLYFSLREITSADSLKESIAKVGARLSKISKA
jgi:uncharacterized membrane protein SpoIIM required for sporulation